MKEHMNKLIGVDISEFVDKGIERIMKAIDSNDFNNIMDAIGSYCKIEELMKNNGYEDYIHEARKRIHEIWYFSSLNKTKF